MRSIPRLDLNWILVILLTVFAVAPLTFPGFFEAHSGFLPVFNIEHISDAPNWGRLADSARGEDKLPYLLGWPFLALTGSGVEAIKWSYGLAFVLGAIGVYAWTRRWLGSKGAVVAATAYTYLPWHLGTVYVRGAYGEAWLWALWPLVLWAADKLSEPRIATRLTGIAVGLPVLAATFWTQPGLAALFIPLLLTYDAVADRKIKQLVPRLAASLILLWLLSHSTPEPIIRFSEHLLYPYQLLSAEWGNGLSFQLGLAAVGLSIVAIALWSSKRVASHPEPLEPQPHSESEPIPLAEIGGLVRYWVVTLLVIVVFTMPLTAPVWELLGIDAFLTYPWQILALAGLPLTFLGGLVIRLDERLADLPAWGGIVALVVVASYSFLMPVYTEVDPGSEPVVLIQPVRAMAPHIALLDYEVIPPTEITPTLTLTLTWQTTEPIVDDYTVFAHLLAPDGSKVTQRDSRPCEGKCPTDTWQPGEIVLDRYQIALPQDAPTGPYQLALGLYLLGSGEHAAFMGRPDQTIILDMPD